MIIIIILVASVIFMLAAIMSSATEYRENELDFTDAEVQEEDDGLDDD